MLTEKEGWVNTRQVSRDPDSSVMNFLFGLGQPTSKTEIMTCHVSQVH